MDADLSESRNVLSANPKIVEELTVILQRYIARGRSTAGPEQKNEADISPSGKKKDAGKKQGTGAGNALKSEAEMAQELRLAADSSFE